MTEILVLVVVLVALSLFKNQIAGLLAGFLAKAASGVAGPPPRIHLTRVDRPEWRNEPAVMAQVKQLVRLGFEDAGTFLVDEMKLAIRALARPSESIYAVVYDHHPDTAGSWLDLVTRYQDGGSATYTTSGGPALDSRPGHDKVRAPGASPEALYRRLVAERPAGRATSPAAPDAFQQVFEQAYAEEMKWRNDRGGATEREIRAVAAASGRKVSDLEVAATRKATESQAAQGRASARSDAGSR